MTDRTLAFRQHAATLRAEVDPFGIRDASARANEETAPGPFRATNERLFAHETEWVVMGPPEHEGYEHRVWTKQRGCELVLAEGLTERDAKLFAAALNQAARS